MQILKSIQDLERYLHARDSKIDCLADTGFLYALSYDDDRLCNKAIETFDLLSEWDLSIYSNVVSRLEFVDLIFRKQVTLGAAKIFSQMDPATVHKELLNLLKNIRDQETAHRRENQSFKVDEGRLKKLRKEFDLLPTDNRWKDFCKKYSGQMLVNEWKLLEEDLGLNFIEILEGETSEMFKQPLVWDDMVQIMGEHGIRAPDAMIVNLFIRSNLPLLVTSDSDIESCFTDSVRSEMTDKAIFVL